MSGDACTMASARSSVAASGVTDFHGTGRSRRCSARSAIPTETPTIDRKKRGVSPRSANCHQRSFEYATFLEAKNPSHPLIASTVTIIRIHRTERNSVVSEERR